MKSFTLKPHQSAIIAAALASLVLWALPVLHWLMLPLQYLNTHLHELAHAFVAQSSGGQVSHIQVFANGSGATFSLGGNALLTASAGYVGATLIGIAMVLASRTEKASRTVLRALAVVLAFGMLIWVRGDVVGIVSGLAWIAALWIVGGRAKGNTLLFAAQFVGVQQCLNSVQSIYILLQLSAMTEAQSDAKILEGLTRIPALFWASAWCLISVAALGWGLRKAWTEPVRPAPSSPGG